MVSHRKDSMMVKLDEKATTFIGEFSGTQPGKKMSISLEQLDSYSFLEDPRYSCANVSICSAKERSDSVECQRVEKKKSIGRKGSSIFARSASLISLKSLFGRGDQSSKRKNSLANQIEMPAPMSPCSEFSNHWNEAECDGFIDVERLELRRERSATLFQLAANQLPGNRSSMLDSRSTNGSMTLSQSGCGSQAKLDKYNSTYEDLIAGKVANVDPKRLEKFLEPEECLDVLGIPKEWLRLVNPRELEERKRQAQLTGRQFKANVSLNSTSP